MPCCTCIIWESCTNMRLSIVFLALCLLDLSLSQQEVPIWGTGTATLKVDNSSCVTLSWSEPEIPNGNINGYEYECTGKERVLTSSRPDNVQICGYSPYTSVVCNIKAGNDNGFSGELSTAALRTSCGAPSPPKTLRVYTSPDKVTHEGRLHWRYYIRWDTPDRTGCSSLLDYELRFPDNDSNALDVSVHNRYRYYLYFLPEVEVKVYVRARNNAWFYSDSVSISFSTGKLNADWGSTAASVQTINTSCITVSWGIPEYPNGNITDYKIKCSGATVWSDVGITPRSYEACGYGPYDGVSCEILAFNNHGLSGSLQSPTGRTACAKPSPPHSIKFNPYTSYTYTDSGRHRGRYSITWTSPTDVNCESVTLYETRFPANTSTTVTSTSSSRTVYTDGNIEVTFWVRAYNNDGFYSDPETLTIITRSIPPQWGSSTAQLVADNSSCVTLSWTEPQYPNGDVFSYRYRCTGYSAWSTIETATSSAQICGFEGYKDVTCSLAAINYQGVGNSITSTSARTFCSEPTPPRSIKFVSSSSTTTNNRKRVEYTVSWSAPQDYHCDRIGRYQTRFPATSPTSLSTTSTSIKVYSYGNEEISVWIQAFNNAGNFSTPAIETFWVPPLEPQWGSANIDLQPHNSSCVVLSWTTPQYPGEDIIGYEHKCTGYSVWTKVDGTKSNTTVCGYRGYSDVECEVKAVSGRGPGDSKTSPSAKTLCEASSPARYVSFGSPSVITQHEYKILRYVVSWRAPSTYYCDSIASYETRFPTTTSESVTTTSTSRTVYTDGSTDVFFWIRVVNSAGNISEPVTVTITSSDIKPQWGSVTAELATSVNAGCVVLSWSVPDFPGGEITDYKYKCTYPVYSWVAVGANKRSAEVCGYAPYTLVSCDVFAVNRAGNGDIITAPSVRTSCSAPSAPKRSIVFKSSSTEVDSGRLRLRYIITWQAPTTTNCESISHYEVRFPTATSQMSTTSSLMTTVYADGSEQITFWVRAVNNAGEVSDPEAKTITTDIIRPQWAPESFELGRDDSNNCITLSWLPPAYTNGLIIAYEHRCTGSDTWTSVSSNINTVQLCGFSGNERVECLLVAKNSAGSSDVATKEILLNCRAPELPADLTQFIVAETYLVENSTEERIRLKLNIPQKYLLINCNSLSSLQYKLTPDSNYTSNGEYVYNVSTQAELTLIIKAENNGGWETAVDWSVKTATLIPTLSMCERPPVVDNAVLIGEDSDGLLGSVIGYSCNIDYTRMKGESLRCELVGDEAVWVGEPSECSKSDPTSISDQLGYILGLGIPLALAILALFITACVCTCKVRRRKPVPIPTSALTATTPSSNVVINMGNISTSLTKTETFDNPAFSKEEASPKEETRAYEKLCDPPSTPVSPGSFAPNPLYQGTTEYQQAPNQYNEYYADPTQVQPSVAAPSPVTRQQQKISEDYQSSGSYIDVYDGPDNEYYTIPETDT